MRIFNGELSGALDVSDALTVNGYVPGPVVVRDGGHLVVNGMLGGRVRVEGERSFITVNGEFTADVVSNEGLILIAGHMMTAPSDVPGRFVVAIDSLVVDERLLPDGRLAPLVQNGDNRMNVNAEKMCVWVAAEGRFRPLDEAVDS